MEGNKSLRMRAILVEKNLGSFILNPLPMTTTTTIEEKITL